MVRPLRVVFASFAFLLLSLAAGGASATVPAVTGYKVSGSPDSTARATTDAACASYVAYMQTQQPTQNYRTPSVVNNSCKFFYDLTDGAHTNTLPFVGVNGVCPANSTASGSACQCNANFDESGGQCVPHTNLCTAKTGVVGVTNWTQGFTRTPDEGDVQAVGAVNRPPVDGAICDSGCTVSIQMSGPGVNYYVSQSPTSNGLYRRSVDYPNLGLGTECTAAAKDAGAQKTTAAPACPGTVGEVNGKTACVGTASKPVTTTPGDVPPVTPVAGNPAAGAKPATGDGSGVGSVGRTPTSGDGGNAGGPAAAGVGGKGGGAGGTAAGSSSGAGGSTTPDDNKDPCGGPGQPVCNVKVDEKGTPTGAGETFNPAKEKMDETKAKNEEQLSKASGSADKGFMEPIRNLFWTPPIAACESMALPSSFNGLSLDPCGVVDGARGLMGFLWAAGGLFVCLGMVKKVI